ncbi:hypothetical protein G5I_11687 [Acromyrmex echinatior]|uniref:Uncharacterized protein n=1 Tax=Acromyrmex echinatior TaxID=103372 RepID=F4X080_ACREC|nr:hypothetical protein G5I_11687 [Acromyrmex echinatior]
MEKETYAATRIANWTVTHPVVKTHATSGTALGRSRPLYLNAGKCRIEQSRCAANASKRQRTPNPKMSDTACNNRTRPLITLLIPTNAPFNGKGPFDEGYGPGRPPPASASAPGAATRRSHSQLCGLPG